MTTLQAEHTFTFSALTESQRLLSSLGYPVEQTAWDVSDLPVSLQRKIRQMQLISTLEKGFERFQAFLIELYPNENYSVYQDTYSVLDAFLRRYPQGHYLFIATISGLRKLILTHPRGVTWVQGYPHQRFIVWSIKPEKTHRLDRWLLRELRITPHDTPSSIANKHRLAFKEAKRRLMILRRKKAGGYSLVLQAFLADVERYPIPNQEQREEFALRASQGDLEAREHLIHAHLRLVYSEARKYQGLGLDLMDLIQEGMIGLMKAVPKFDPSLGYQFSTYAMWWIRQRIMRALANDSRSIRIPVHVYEEINKILDSEHKLKQILERTPTNYELALVSNHFSEDEKLEAWFAEISENTWLSSELKSKILRIEKKIEQALAIVQGILPLDETVPVDVSLHCGVNNEEVQDGITLSELISANDDELEVRIEQVWLKELVAKALTTLDERSRIIVELKVGFTDGEEKTLQEVGDQFGVTRERIRQIETKALEKLIHILKNYGLEKWWNEKANDKESKKDPDNTKIRMMVKAVTNQVDCAIWKSDLNHWKKLPAEKRWEKIRQASLTTFVGEEQTPSLDNFVANYTTPEYLRRSAFRKLKLAKQIPECVEPEDQETL